MRTRSSPAAVYVDADGSSDSLRVLKRVDVIRDDMQLIENDLPDVRESLRKLLAAVNEGDRQNVQRRLSKLCESAKRAELLLCSMSLFCEQDRPDGTLTRIVKTQGMKIGCHLMKIIDELRQCHEELATVLRKQLGISNSLGIVADCAVRPHKSKRSRKSNLCRQSFSCPSLPSKVEQDDHCSPQAFELATIEKQLTKLLKLSATVADLVSDQNDLFDNIEHQVTAQRDPRSQMSCGTGHSLVDGIELESVDPIYLSYTT